MGLIFFLLLVAVSSKRVFPEYTSFLEVPAGWTPVPNAKGANPNIPLTVALKQRNTDKLTKFVDHVSNPRDPMYGKYKSLSDIARMVAPEAKNVNAVIRWFQAKGFGEFQVTPSGDWLKMVGPVSAVNEALQTEVMLWTNVAMKKSVWRSVVPYSVPETIAPLIDFIIGVHHFPAEKKSLFFAPEDARPIGPRDLRTRYNVTDFSPSGLNNTQAVAEFQGQYYSPSDLTQFFSQYFPGKNSTVAGVIGPNMAGSPGVEAELDIQYIMGVNPNVPTYFYSQSSFEFWSDLTNWITVLNSDPKPPLVHSVSYGEQAEHTVSASYKDRFNTEMQKLGGRGITIIFASGDSGCGCFLCVRFTPSFPATTPYLTSVGATQFIGSGAVTPGSQESAVSQFGSGGGFSWHFDRPSYQSSAVGSYISNHGNDIPAQFHWSKNGRATPDVAALGIGFSVVVNGAVESIGGTSASAPTFAAIISILNGQQLARGKPALGFLNPWLYQSAAANNTAFFDVTVGSNPDTCCRGFDCAPGWDAVTGLGTPNYATLKTLLP